MDDELRDLLDREAVRVHARAEALEEVRRRARPRRARALRTAGTLAAGILLLGALGWAGVVLWGLRGAGRTPTDASGPANYDLIVRAVETQPGGDAVVRFTSGWSSDSFPGWHTCTFTVFDMAGAPIGDRSEETVILEPGHRAAIIVKVDGRPDTATATCDPGRLDVGDPYAFDFRDVEVRPFLPVEVRFRPVWLGSGKPGVVACSVAILDPDGNEVGRRPSHTFVFGEDGRRSSVYLEQGHMASGFDQHVLEDPGGYTAEFDCEPFQGSGSADDEPRPSWTNGGTIATPDPFHPDDVPYELRGPEHCGWERSTWLSYLGGRYARDPSGTTVDDAGVTYDGDAALPEGAGFTGWHSEGRELWVDPSDRDEEGLLRNVYLVTEQGVERLPLFPLLCM